MKGWLAIAVAGIWIQTGWGADAPPNLDWPFLMKFEGLDLRSDGYSAAGAACEAYLARTAPEGFREKAPLEGDIGGSFAVWYLWRYLGQGGKMNCVILEVQPTFAIPGEVDGRLTWMGEDGKYLRSVRFNLGWRTYVQDAFLLRDSSLGVPLIVFKMASTDYGWQQITPPLPKDFVQDVREYYALRDDTVDLVRIENNLGTATRNRSYAQNLAYGLWPVPLSVPETLAALRSLDRAKTARTLVWLGGRHGAPGGPAGVTGEETSAEFSVWNTVRHDPKVRQELRRLSDGADPWLAEEADLALHPVDSFGEPVN